MIRCLAHTDKEALMNYLYREIITNYFIILSLERSEYEEMFEKKWAEFDENDNIRAVLLKRKTGNMQFYSREDYDVKAFTRILESEVFNMLIGEESILEKFNSYYRFSIMEKGPFIARMDSLNVYPEEKDLSLLNKVEIKDLDGIVELYKKVFKGSASKKSMVEKYEKETGRGYYIAQDGRIVCVAQTAYEVQDSGLIVGVATDPEFRNRGYASTCVSKLCSELIDVGKTLYLQYDDEGAGKMYKRLGFYDIGRMAFYHA